MPYMGLLLQSTQVTKTVLLVDSTDHVTGKTGLSAGITKYLSKNGTAASATMTTAEVDATNVKGVYNLTFTTTHTDTIGDFQLHLTGTGADPADYWWTVVAATTDNLVRSTTPANTLSVDANHLVAVPTTQKVDIDTIKTNPVVNAGTVTFPTGATLASTTNLTAGTVATVTNAVTLPSIPAGWITAAGIADAAIDNATFAADVGSTALATNMIAKAAEKAVGVAGVSLTNTGIPAATVTALGTGSTLTACLTATGFATPTNITAATGITVATNSDKTGYTVSTVSDKTGYSLAASQHVIVDSGTVTTLTNAPGDSSGVTTLLGRVVGTLDTGTHKPQTGDSYAIINGTSGPVAIKVDTAAIKLKTDNLPASPAAVGSAMTLTAAYDSAKTAASQTSVNTIDTNVDTILTDAIAILAAVDTEIASILAKVTLIPTGIAKNTALNNFEFSMLSSTDHVSAVTGASITATRSIDGGSFAACANAASEIGTTGIYKINLANTDLNGTIIALKFSAAGCDDTIIFIKTEATS